MKKVILSMILVLSTNFALSAECDVRNYESKIDDIVYTGISKFVKSYSDLHSGSVNYNSLRFLAHPKSDAAKSLRIFSEGKKNPVATFTTFSGTQMNVIMADRNTPLFSDRGSVYVQTADIFDNEGNVTGKGCYAYTGCFGIGCGSVSKLTVVNAQTKKELFIDDLYDYAPTELLKVIGK